ncbi:MAG TPA: hypothetical protein VII13_22465 [Vicinamibacteria bacterium]
MLTPQTEERERAVREEARRLRELRALVDLASSVIVQGRLGRAEALELVGATRRRILELFPDKEDTYELVLAPRFARLVAEHGRPAARVLPFPR